MEPLFESASGSQTNSDQEESYIPSACLPEESQCICEECGKLFANQTYVNKHKKLVHLAISEEHQKCPKCPMTFKSLKTFWQHVVLVHEKKIGGYPEGGNESSGCEDDVFESRSLSESVKAAKSPKKRIRKPNVRTNEVCKECGKVFYDKSTLKRHVRLIHVQPEPTISCPKCDKKFKQAAHLNQHLQEKHDQSLFPCGLCGLTMCSESGLTRHLRNAHGTVNEAEPQQPNSTQCQFCHQVVSKIDYNNHVREVHSEHYNQYVAQETLKECTETKTRDPARCGICKNLFYDKSSLRRHVSRAHTKSGKRYSCPECGKTFLENNNLQNHLIVHKNSIMEPHVKAMLKTVFGTVCNPSMTCGICNTIVHSSLEAKLHLYIKHSEKFHELITQKAPSCRTQCGFCEDLFSTKEALIKHIESNHPEQHIPTCKYCGHKEVKEREMNFHYKNSHPQNQRYTCDFCQMSFSQRRSLEGHIRREHSSDASQCPYCPEKHERVKMHVTKKHPDKVEEYSKMVQDTILEEREARKKFNQFLFLTARRAVTKAKRVEDSKMIPIRN